MPSSPRWCATASSTRPSVGGRAGTCVAPARAALLARVQAAASGDDELDARTALLLAMTGPAHLLEVVAPARADRRHARRRIDHALDAGTLRDVSAAVRQVLADAAAATVAATTAAVVASGS